MKSIVTPRNKNLVFKKKLFTIARLCKILSKNEKSEIPIRKMKEGNIPILIRKRKIQDRQKNKKEEKTKTNVKAP